ncbi:MAG: hypothetical protein JW864_19045 [Spirochaetes bacterium]|nr:hypothetical protein [Spirochaetota bacterium]
MLVFHDDTRISLSGLDDIMAELHSESKEANDETVNEIIRRLEAKKNYIPSSDRARKDYSYALLKEYRKYIKNRKEEKK